MSRLYVVTLLIVAGRGWNVLKISQNVKQTGGKHILLGKNGTDRPWGRATKLQRKKPCNTLNNDKMRDAWMQLLPHWHHINHTGAEPMHIKNVEVYGKVFGCFYAFFCTLENSYWRQTVNTHSVRKSIFHIYKLIRYNITHTRKKP